MVLKELGFSNCVLHSMSRQKMRLEAMALFKSHKVKILVATDLASRSEQLRECCLKVQGGYIRAITLQWQLICKFKVILAQLCFSNLGVDLS